MWGWMGITLGGVLIVLLVVALAFGTSASLFAVLIAAGALVVIGVLYALRRFSGGSGGSSSRNPRSGGAPASGEGSDSAHPPQDS